MAERKECKKYIDCGFRKELAGCPLSCIHYKHKDEARVVRCKDCKYLYPGSDFVSKHCSLIGIPTDDDDFCSHGENKK